MHTPLLPSSNSSCTRPAVTCASCLLGASTKTLTFPYNITQTVDVTIIPCVTGLPNGTNVTYGYETITPPGLPTNSGMPTVFEDNSTTIWVTDGATLTYPTTYASFENFSGVAAPTPAPTACAQAKDVHPIFLPATTDRASLIYTPTAGTNAIKELHFGHLPTPLLAYLDSLSTVVQQLGGNRPGTCSSTRTSAPSACKTPRPSMQNFTIPGNISATAPPPENLGPLLGAPGPPAIQKIPAVVLRRTAGPVKFTPYTAQDATKPKVEAVNLPNIGNNKQNGDNHNDGGASSAQLKHSNQQQAGNQTPSNPIPETKVEGSNSRMSSGGQLLNVNVGGSSSGSTSPPSEDASGSTSHSPGREGVITSSGGSDALKPGDTGSHKSEGTESHKSGGLESNDSLQFGDSGSNRPALSGASGSGHESDVSSSSINSQSGRIENSQVAQEGSTGGNVLSTTSGNTNAASGGSGDIPPVSPGQDLHSVSGTDRYSSSSSLAPSDNDQSLGSSAHNDAANPGLPNASPLSAGINLATGSASGESPASGASNESDTTNSGKSLGASPPATAGQRTGNSSSTTTNISAAGRRGMSSLRTIVIIAAIAAAA
ncbi:hypothetical protein CKM354_000909700 [Cercospora kikuchii]|uniref:Uncharacterized protein n=1 Tax=Cercospora kikuchii TaxID=84275 RepID=A0A9P3CNY5_9PEZI|nr:uncharacterized protein CKM354_000909700 [Cercospora kikuchii]GIZ45951.1 hypothetical protein CKM354_000909700 [Cercospora kikuchii]